MGDDGAGEVFVDQACGGELGFVRGGEGFGEGALVVVEVLGAVVLALDLGGVSGWWQGRGGGGGDPRRRLCRILRGLWGRGSG